jgi:hypothetical protein
MPQRGMEAARAGAMRVISSALLAIALATPACLGADDKGGEDDVPGADAKADSLTSPTDHGELAFGIANNASFTDAEGFHAWTFTLTDAASVEIATELNSANLDSVMYLYRRTSPTASWGAYTHRNDDADDSTQASKLTLDLTAAEYRVGRPDDGRLRACHGAARGDRLRRHLRHAHRQGLRVRLGRRRRQHRHRALRSLLAARARAPRGRLLRVVLRGAVRRAAPRHDAHRPVTRARRCQR